MDARKTERQGVLVQDKKADSPSSPMDIKNTVNGDLGKIHQIIHESTQMTNLHTYVGELLKKENIDAVFTVSLNIEENNTDETDDTDVAVNEDDDQDDDQDDDFDD